jgi:iron complex transport system permease protein
VTAARRHRGLLLLGLLLLAALVLLCSPFAGIRQISPSELFDPATRGEADIFWRWRVPRVMVAFLAGAGLALCGMAFQAMFRNPLATPFTLGVSSGASLGAALYLRMGLTFTLGVLPGISAFAFVGALTAILIVYGITRMRRGFSTATMLLAGVAVSLFFSGLIMLTQYLALFRRAIHIMHWLMGSMNVSGYADVFAVLPFAAGGAIAIIYLSNELNMLTTGEDIAASRGVAVKRVKLLLFFVTSMAVGGIVAICGPVGFVGMMVPHICRMIVGSDHRYLAPASFLFGGAFLVLCDRFSVMLAGTAEMPVGIITALLGGPFFLWLLVRRGPARIA